MISITQLYTCTCTCSSELNQFKVVQVSKLLYLLLITQSARKWKIEMSCDAVFCFTLGTIAWSDTGKGGWLMYCLYHVFHDVTYTEDDLLTILTQVCGKMAISMETYCPSTPRFDKAKSAACVYHRLSKDIYLQPNWERGREILKVYAIYRT